MSVAANFETHFLTTPDGINLGYLKTGAGPALILVHGGLQSSANFTELAAALSTNFTVYIPDRRGRGLSDPYNGRGGLVSETADLRALIHAVGASYIFALSSGAVITINAALQEPDLLKIALYEPPLPENESIFGRLEHDYNSALKKGDFGRAFIAILKRLDDTTFSLLRALPVILSAPIANLMIKLQAKADQGTEPTLKDLLPTFHYDQVLIKDALSDHLIEKTDQIKAEIMLMDGNKSQPFLRRVIERLKKLVPNASYVNFPRQGHLAADNSGSPKLVAAELLSFFLA